MKRKYIKRLISVFTALMILSSLFGTAFAAPAAADTWQIKTPMPESSWWMGYTEAGGKVYSVGRAALYDQCNKMYEYNPLTDAWTSKAPMPTARYGLGAASYNGTIYAIGGNCNNVIVNTVEAYNIATNTWTTKASMPTARMNMAVVEYGGKIYAMGGNNSGTASLNVVKVYNPTLNAWTPAAEMPRPRTIFSAVVCNNLIYAIGDINDERAIDVYNPATNTWTPHVATLPLYGNGSRSIVVNGKIYVVCCSQDGVTYNKVVEYNPATDQWTYKANIPTPRERFGIAAVGKKIYAYGGMNGTTVQNVMEMYSPLENAAPVINAPSIITANNGDTVTFTVTASDPDFDAVALEAVSMPEGATFDPATGEFNYIASLPIGGGGDTPDFIVPCYNYQVVFQASDGDLSVQYTVTICVNNGYYQ